MNKLFVFLVLVAVGATTLADDTFTGTDLNERFTIHGRLSNYNGSNTMRIWIVGSKRLLYVGADSPLLHRIDEIFRRDGSWFSRDIFGDFTVDPLAPDIKGHMRPVRLVAVTNVVMTLNDQFIEKRNTL